MEIIAHRGLWGTGVQGNTMEAFRQAFENDFGIETDIRDYCGKLVVSHNIALEDSFEFEKVVELYHSLGCKKPMAINIKADGIQTILSDVLKKFDIESYFVFDMSVPEQVVYLKENFKTFARMSEYEKKPVLYEQVCGVWMDEWGEPWIDVSTIKRIRDDGKLVGIISPEIHKRDNIRLWEQLKELKKDEGVFLCTDLAKEAGAFFYGK